MFIRLRELREKRGLAQKEISNFLEISETLYSLYESGQKKIPVSILSKIAKFYNTSIDYIVGDTNQFTPHN